MTARKKKPAARRTVKPAPKAGKTVRGAKKPVTRRATPVPPSAIGRKTQSQPDWVDVTITRWNGFFRGVMMEVLSNYTRGGFEALIAGRGIGFFATVEAAKEACVSAVLERSA